MKYLKKVKQIKSDNKRCETAPSYTHSELKIYSKKQEFLFSHKSSLETLLKVIKDAQISFLSNNIKKSKISNIKKLKKLLIELKDSLNSMYNEQKAKTTFFGSLSVQQKAKIQSQLYENLKKNSSFQKMKAEIEQLKDLNFKVQNDIIFIENLILKNYYIEQYLNKNIIRQEEEKEINCMKPKSYSMTTYLLHMKNIETKKQFKDLVSIKQRQNEQMNWVTKCIDQLKFLIYNKENGYNNYIYAEDIIPEESKEYTKSMTINNINNTLNNILLKKNQNFQNENDEFQSDNSSLISIEKNTDNKKNINKLNNFINVNMNMNINFNFNFDKIYNIKDDIKYNLDRDINSKDNKKARLKYKKSFPSTDCLPYLLINSIKDEKKSTEKKGKDDFYKYKNKTVVLNEFLSEDFLPTI